MDKPVKRKNSYVCPWCGSALESEWDSRRGKLVVTYVYCSQCTYSFDFEMDG